MLRSWGFVREGVIADGGAWLLGRQVGGGTFLRTGAIDIGKIYEET